MPAPLSVPHARSLPIGDRPLAQLRRVAHDVPNALASEAEAEWLLSVVGPLLDELAARRAWMAEHAPEVTDDTLANVVVLQPVRG